MRKKTYFHEIGDLEREKKDTLSICEHVHNHQIPTAINILETLFCTEQIENALYI